MPIRISFKMLLLSINQRYRYQHCKIAYDLNDIGKKSMNAFYVNRKQTIAVDLTTM